jgi:hypothetical protein
MYVAGNLLSKKIKNKNIPDNLNISTNFMSMSIIARLIEFKWLQLWNWYHYHSLYLKANCPQNYSRIDRC